MSEKGAEEAERFVEYSLQRLRDLPPLTPVEPSIDISSELPLSLKFSGISKPSCQGAFGDVYLDSINDHYRPSRRAPPKRVVNSSSSLERRYRLCSSLLDRPPCLPSPPLLTTASEKFDELINETNDVHGDESIVSTSTAGESEDSINDIEMENARLLHALSAPYERGDLRPMSPILPSHPYHPFAISDPLPSGNEVASTEKVS